MNTTTEQLKRAMYDQLGRMNACRKAGLVAHVSLPDFEDLLECYLEALHQDAQEGAAKLHSQTQTIIALHRVIKCQQTSLASLQGHLEIKRKERNNDQARAHKEIMQAECISEERLEQLQAKQKLIVSQRETIETLTFELYSARKQAKRLSFLGFFARKSIQTKQLTK